MLTIYSVYASFLLASGILSGLLLILLFKYRNNTIAKALFGLGVTSLGINLSLLVSMVSPDAQSAQLWHGNIRLIFNSFIAPAGFLFVYKFLDGKNKKLNWLVFSIPALTLVVSLTNDLHHWLFSSYNMQWVGYYVRVNWQPGWWFVVFAIYSSVISFGLVYLLFAWIGRTRKLPRWRGVLVIGTVFFITISIILDTFGVYIAPGLLTLPIGFGLMNLILILGVWYLDLFDILPIARETLTRYIADGFFVVDTNNLVLDANPATMKLTGQSVEEMLGKDVLSFITNPERRELAQKVLQGEFQGVLPFFIDGVDRFYDIVVTNIFVEQHVLVAKLIVLRDVSELKRLQKDESRRVALEERQRLARDLHDAVSQTLFSARLTSEMLLRQKESLPSETLWARISHFDGLVKSALGEMRILLLELRPEGLVNADLPTLIAHLVDAASARIEASIQLDVQAKHVQSVDVKIAFYRIAQEALNNIVKHSRSKNIHIQLISDPGSMFLAVKDDGIGLEIDTAKGTKMGLEIMRERAAGIGATLEIITQAGKGTCITCLWQKDKEILE
jgi:PAS domain S-box-containing protein